MKWANQHGGKVMRAVILFFLLFIPIQPAIAGEKKFHVQTIACLDVTAIEAVANAHKYGRSNGIQKARELGPDGSQACFATTLFKLPLGKFVVVTENPRHEFGYVPMQFRIAETGEMVEAFAYIQIERIREEQGV